MTVAMVMTGPHDEACDIRINTSGLKRTLRYIEITQVPWFCRASQETL